MFYGFRYIQTDESGKVCGGCDNPVVIDGAETTIDTEGMSIPEMPTDAIYELHCTKEQGLHWVKVADFEEEIIEPTQLDRIEAAVAKSNEEIAQAARDAYTLELIEGGVIA